MEEFCGDQKRAKLKSEYINFLARKHNTRQKPVLFYVC